MTCSVCGGSGRVKKPRHLWPKTWFILNSDMEWACHRCNGTGSEPEPEYVHMPPFSIEVSPAGNAVTIDPPMIG